MDTEQNTMTQKQVGEVVFEMSGNGQDFGDVVRTYLDSTTTDLGRSGRVSRMCNMGIRFLGPDVEVDRVVLTRWLLGHGWKPVVS